MATKPCPICRERYFDLKDTKFVCEQHQTWFVTRCQLCGRYSLSDCVSFCYDCVGYGVYADNSKTILKKPPR